MWIMPEVISKYPEITLKVLKEVRVRCGLSGLKFQPGILTKCPAERFCSLPTCEICVYGLSKIPQMTQITREEIAPLVADQSFFIRLSSFYFGFNIWSGAFE